LTSGREKRKLKIKNAKKKTNLKEKRDWKRGRGGKKMAEKYSD